MKKYLAAAAVCFVAFALSACNGSAPTLTPQQAIALVCADSNTAVEILSADGVFTGGAQATLTDKVSPAIAKVCAAGATVSTPNLQNLANVAIPLLKTGVSSSSLSVQQKADANAAIDLAALAVNTAIALQPVAVPTAPASAAPVASAPAAASTPLAGAPLQ